jgi:hypothetical protein
MNPLLAIIIFVGGPAAALVGWTMWRDHRRSREAGDDARERTSIADTRSRARGDIENFGGTIGMGSKRPRR